jgi:arabinose-5-phosphate isomerase
MTTTRPIEIQAPANEELDFLSEALRAEADAIGSLAQRVSDHDSSDWLAALDLLTQCGGHVVVSGMGKSGLVGAKISATFSSLGQPSHVIHPAEAVHGDLGRVRRGDVVLLLSYSGETDEIVNLAAILQSDDVPRLGISSNPKSKLAQLSTVHLSIGDVTEACPMNLTPTASTTAMLAVGDALALALARRRNFKADDFHKHHPGGMLGIGLRRITEALRFTVGKNLAVVRDTLTVREACEQASATGGRRAGAIMLVDDRGRLSGIFTDGDLRRLILRDPQGMDRPIRDIMTPRPQHLTTDDLVRDAVRLMRQRRLDEIPVLDHDGRPVGLVDVQDLIAMKVVSE